MNLCLWPSILRRKFQCILQFCFCVSITGGTIRMMRERTQGEYAGAFCLPELGIVKLRGKGVSHGDRWVSRRMRDEKGVVNENPVVKRSDCKPAVGKTRLEVNCSIFFVMRQKLGELALVKSCRFTFSVGISVTVGQRNKITQRATEISSSIIF